MKIMHHQTYTYLNFSSEKYHLLLYQAGERFICSLNNSQQSTVQLFLVLYTPTVEEIQSGSPVQWRYITYLFVCLNLLLSNDTSFLKIVSHLPGRPGYVISFIQDMRHKQDMHLTEVRDSRIKLQLPQCTSREKHMISTPRTAASWMCEFTKVNYFSQLILSSDS